MKGTLLRRDVSSGEQGPVDEIEGAKKKNGSETRRWHAAPEAGVNALAGRENSDVCTNTKVVPQAGRSDRSIRSANGAEHAENADGASTMGPWTGLGLVHIQENAAGKAIYAAGPRYLDGATDSGEEPEREIPTWYNPHPKAGWARKTLRSMGGAGRSRARGCNFAFCSGEEVEARRE